MIIAIIYLVILIVIHKFVKKIKSNGNKAKLLTYERSKWAFWALIILNILHIIEDILENMQWFSLEYFLWGLYDHDSFQNFIGDILSGIIGSYIVYIIYTKIINN